MKKTSIRRFSIFLLSILFSCNSPALSHGNLVELSQSNLVERSRRSLLPIVALENLSAPDREVAEQLEIWTMLKELYDKNKAPEEARKNVLRQKIRETILESYFDAAAFQSEAEREQLRLEALRQNLLGRRDRSIEFNNATNFIASGALNTLGSVLGFSAKDPPFTGNFFQMLGGVVSTGMSTYALKQNNGGKTHGQGHSTVIAELFGRPVDERTSYPESVWRFIHGISVDEPDKTRAQFLEARWIARHELEPHGSKREKQKIDAVSGVSGAKKSMSLDDITDEINMIVDLSAVASLMAHHLRDLLSLIDSDVVI